MAPGGWWNKGQAAAHIGGLAVALLGAVQSCETFLQASNQPAGMVVSIFFSIPRYNPICSYDWGILVAGCFVAGGVQMQGQTLYRLFQQLTSPDLASAVVNKKDLDGYEIVLDEGPSGARLLMFDLARPLPGYEAWVSLGEAGGTPYSSLGQVLRMKASGQTCPRCCIGLVRGGDGLLA